MPPLLQRLMSQPGSSVRVEDIERQSYTADITASASDVINVSTISSISNGASVPKMASPPKTVSAKWSLAEPDSPNTVIKRSLNMVLDKRVFTSDTGAVMHSSHSATDVMSATSGASASQLSDRSLLIDNARSSSTSSVAKPQTSTPDGDVSASLRKLNLSEGRGRDAGSFFERSASPDATSAGRKKPSPSLRLDTSVVVPADVDIQPELVTPQALLDKSALTFNQAFMSSQVAPKLLTCCMYIHRGFKSSFFIWGLVELYVLSLSWIPTLQAVCCWHRWPSNRPVVSCHKRRHSSPTAPTPLATQYPVSASVSASVIVRQCLYHSGIYFVIHVSRK